MTLGALLFVMHRKLMGLSAFSFESDANRVSDECLSRPQTYHRDTSAIPHSRRSCNHWFDSNKLSLVMLVWQSVAASSTTSA